MGRCIPDILKGKKVDSLAVVSCLFRLGPHTHNHMRNLLMLILESALVCLLRADRKAILET